MDPRIQNIKCQDIDEFIKLNKNALYILDVRTPGEFAIKHLENANNTPISSLLINNNLVPKDKKLLCYCAHGFRSKKAAKLLIRRGYEKVYNLEGGLSNLE